MNRDRRGVSDAPSRRRMLVPILISCGGLAVAVPAMADALSADAATTGSNPAEPLWRAYPLEQTVTAPAASAVPSTDPARRASPRPAAPEPAARTPWIALLL